VSNWDDCISTLFAEPYWIGADKRQDTGQGWAGCMTRYGIDLNDYDGVRKNSELIFPYLHSRAMSLPAIRPNTGRMRRWEHSASPSIRVGAGPAAIRSTIRNGPPGRATGLVLMQIGRDLRSLAHAELDDYRVRVDDCLQVANAAPDAPG
jgi:hypothetical protein